MSSLVQKDKRNWFLQLLLQLLFMRETDVDVDVDVVGRKWCIVCRSPRKRYTTGITYRTTQLPHAQHTCCCCLKVFWVIGAFLHLLLLPPMFLYRSMTINIRRERERERPATIRWSLFINHKREREKRRRLAWKRWAVTVCVWGPTVRRSTMTQTPHATLLGGHQTVHSPIVAPIVQFISLSTPLSIQHNHWTDSGLFCVLRLACKDVLLFKKRVKLWDWLNSAS